MADSTVDDEMATCRGLVLRLEDRASTAVLARIVSVLHRRGAEVVEMTFGTIHDGSVQVALVVFGTPDRLRTLLSTFENTVGVLEVVVKDLHVRSA